MAFSMCKYYFNIIDFKYMSVCKYSQGNVLFVCINSKIIYIYIYIYISPPPVYQVEFSLLVRSIAYVTVRGVIFMAIQSIPLMYSD